MTLPVIHHSLAIDSPPRHKVLVRVDRLTLAKRRWRAKADDGREFGFDLKAPLQNGALVLVEGETGYWISQHPEAVLEVHLEHASAVNSARCGWLLGNLHFPVEIGRDLIRVADDPAVRQMLTREKIEYVPSRQLFTPVRSRGHSHGR